MTGQHRWRDAELAASRLTESDRRALLLLVHLPLIWEAAMERLFGLRGGASVYRGLARLREMGLVSEIRPGLRARRNPGLLYLTDFGLATVAVDQRVAPNELARFRVFNAKTWNPIALVDDVLLVRNDQEAACLRLPVVSDTK